MSDSFLSHIIFRPAIEADAPTLAIIHRTTVLGIENTQYTEH